MKRSWRVSTVQVMVASTLGLLALSQLPFAPEASAAPPPPTVSSVTPSSGPASGVVEESGFPQDSDAMGNSSIAVTTQAVGDLVILSEKQHTSGVTVTGVTGGNVTSWTRAVSYANTDGVDPTYDEVWYGTATAVGASSISVSYSQDVSASDIELIADSYTALDGGSAWSVVQAGGAAETSASASATWPVLTSNSSPDQLYWGSSAEQFSGTAGSDPGFQYHLTSGANCFLANGGLTANTDYSPSCGQSPAGVSTSVGVIFDAGFSGGTSVDVTGTGFAQGDTVTFGGVQATGVAVHSATSLTATAPPSFGPALAGGTVDVLVSNGSATSATVPADEFTYTFASLGSSIGLASTSTSPLGGTQVTLTATAGQDVGPEPYGISIIDTWTGTQIAHTGSGTTVSAMVSQSASVTRRYVAELDVMGGAPVYAVSAPVVVSWVLPTPTTPTITNLPASGTVNASFLAAVSTTGDGVESVTSNSPTICTVGIDGLTVTPISLGSCSLTAHVAAGATYLGANGTAQSFNVDTKATPTTPTITNLPASGTVNASFLAAVSTTGDGVESVTSNSPTICTVGIDGLTVTPISLGSCSLTAHVAAGATYLGANGTAQSFNVDTKATPTTPTITNLPASGTVNASFLAAVSTTGDGVESVTSNSPTICTVGIDGLTVTPISLGSCSLTAHVAAGATYLGANGTAQSFNVDTKATPTTPTITNLPASGTVNASFLAAVSTTGDGVESVTSNSPTICTVGIDGLTVTPISLGSCSLTAHVAAGATYLGANGTAQSFNVDTKATPTTPTITNLPASGTVNASFLAAVSTTGDGVDSVTSNSPTICTVGIDGLTVTPISLGSCSLTAHVAAGATYLGANGTAQSFNVDTKATPTTPTITNLPASGTVNASFLAAVSTTGDGVDSVTSNSPTICTVGIDGLTVTPISLGSCSLTAHVAAGATYLGANGTAQSFNVDTKATPTTPTITNLPASGTVNASFLAAVSTTGDGVESVTSNSPTICTVGIDGLTVTPISLGSCSLTAHVAAGATYLGANGTAQSFNVDTKATPTTPTITNLPASGTVNASFLAAVSTTGDGVESVTSNSPTICTVGIDGLTVTPISLGSCSLTAHVAAGATYLGANGTAQSFNVSTTTTFVSGTSLSPGQSLISANGLYRAKLSRNGSLVVLGPAGAIFSTETVGLRAGVSLTLQRNGNLVLRSASGASVWSSMTKGLPVSYMVMRNNGSLVLRSANGTSLWNSLVGRL